tara:strand:+ start:1120 stop:1452 length:333 start_codon:yes stop_codon:yes gene_type:complete
MFHYNETEQIILHNPSLQKKRQERETVLRKVLDNKVKDVEGPVQDCKQLRAKFTKQRTDAKLSQADLAKKCNIDKSLINKLEQGNLSLVEAKQICLKAQKWIGQLLNKTT